MTLFNLQRFEALKFVLDVACYLNQYVIVTSKWQTENYDYIIVVFTNIWTWKSHQSMKLEFVTFFLIALIFWSQRCNCLCQHIDFLLKLSLDYICLLSWQRMERWGSEDGNDRVKGAILYKTILPLLLHLNWYNCCQNRTFVCNPSSEHVHVSGIRFLFNLVDLFVCQVVNLQTK